MMLNKTKLELKKTLLPLGQEFSEDFKLIKSFLQNYEEALLVNRGFLAGGCLRDLVNGGQIKDLDIFVGHTYNAINLYKHIKLTINELFGCTIVDEYINETRGLYILYLDGPIREINIIYKKELIGDNIEMKIHNLLCSFDLLCCCILVNPEDIKFISDYIDVMYLEHKKRREDINDENSAKINSISDSKNKLLHIVRPDKHGHNLQRILKFVSKGYKISKQELEDFCISMHYSLHNGKELGFRDYEVGGDSDYRVNTTQVVSEYE